MSVLVQRIKHHLSQDFEEGRLCIFTSVTDFFLCTHICNMMLYDMIHYFSTCLGSTSTLYSHPCASRLNCSSEVHGLSSNCIITANVCFPAWVMDPGPAVHYGCKLLILSKQFHQCCNYSEFSDVASSREPFDLCEQHYGNSFNLPSLFNQQHNSEHKFNNVGGARITIAGVLRMNENKLLISISRRLGHMAPRAHMMN